MVMLTPPVAQAKLHSQKARTNLLKVKLIERTTSRRKIQGVYRRMLQSRLSLEMSSTGGQVHPAQHEKTSKQLRHEV